MWYKKFLKRTLEQPLEKNAIDKKIIARAGEPTEIEIYKARWVWYHTILAVEIFFTNILLLAILLILGLK